LGDGGVEKLHRDPTNRLHFQGRDQRSKIEEVQSLKWYAEEAWMQHSRKVDEKDPAENVLRRWKNYLLFYLT